MIFCKRNIMKNLRMSCFLVISALNRAADTYFLIILLTYWHFKGLNKAELPLDLGIIRIH